eukprot:10653321-Karenia_brevis.AAC.1
MASRGRSMTSLHGCNNRMAQLPPGPLPHSWASSENRKMNRKSTMSCWQIWSHEISKSETKAIEVQQQLAQVRSDHATVTQQASDRTGTLHN